MSFVVEEIDSQPALWREAGALAAECADELPVRGERVAFFGCGTSLYIAQAVAAAREGAGHGESDAFPASEMPAGRRCSLAVALSRSGKTAQAWSEAYPTMEYRHGPISVAAPGGAVWALNELPAGLADEIVATGATLVTSRGDPLAELVRVQRLAVATSRMRGFDPDRPRIRRARWS